FEGFKSSSWSARISNLSWGLKLSSESQTQFQGFEPTTIFI
ncbi:11924_t:CDS:1, partial [Dentiscutata erythropus]